MIYHNENENDSEKLIKLFSLVSGNAGDKKNLHSSGRNFFFFFFWSIFQRYSLFFISFFCFFWFLFFLLFICFFLNTKMYIVIHIRLCRRVRDKKFSPGWFPETSKTTSFLGPMCSKKHLSNTWGSIYQEVKQHWGCCL